MLKLINSISIIFLLVFPTVKCDSDSFKVFCYYDSRSFFREAQGKMTLDDLLPALTRCTHLIYAYAGISSIDYKMIPLNKKFDTLKGDSHYKKVTNFRAKYPDLKILLSVGGGADTEVPEKYNQLLETTEGRTNFIESSILLLKEYNFDGINLAWQFPTIKPKKIRTHIASLWHGLKKTIGIKKLVDEKFEEHREQFSRLVREMKFAYKNEGFQLTASVLPNVNSSLYFDTYALMDHLDYIILHAFDYYTPDRNPKEADFTAPLKELEKRNPESNIDALVTHWIFNDFPAEKIILGIPTFGRAWRLDCRHDESGIPPVRVDGPATEGPYTKEPGLLSYTEVCTSFMGVRFAHLQDPKKHLARVPDATNSSGVYAYRLPDHKGERGLWISYEDPEAVSHKLAFAKDKNIGGIAIVDLSLDDFGGICTEEKFPLLKTAWLTEFFTSD